MTKNTLVAGGAILASALLLTACSTGSGGNSGPVHRDDVNVVSPAQPSTIDPQLSTDHITAEITRPIFEPLISIDGEYKIQPVLAESYERSEDGLTFTFNLRKGVKFQDGSDLDAHDVVLSMERWMRNTPNGSEVFPDASWEEIDPLTVALHVTKASFLHEIELSSRMLQVPAIMPSEVVEEFGDKPITTYVGTGPYEFDEWKSDQYLQIKKWNDYQPADGEASGLVGDKTGVLNAVKFNFVSDPATRVMSLQSGLYDIATEVPYDNLEQVYADPNLEVGQYLITPQQMVFSTKADSPVANVDFRQAVNTGIDRDPIMLAAVGGDESLYDLQYQQMAKQQEAVWNTEIGSEGFNSHDTAAAKKLLKQAGYNGETLKLIVTKDYSESYNSAVVLQQQLEALDISVELEPLEWGAYSERVEEQPDTWDLTVFPAVMHSDPSKIVGFQANYPGHFPSERYDAMMNHYLSLTTLEEAQVYYNDMQQYIEDVRPLVKLGDVANVYAASTSLKVSPFDSTIRWWAVSYK